MGANPGNQNAKKKGRTRVSACLSIADEKEKNRLSWAIEQVIARRKEPSDREPTDQEVSSFIKEVCYKHIDEMMQRSK